ncbi:MAG: hypothetical protein JSR33_10265 [Proteobacteria bacterium]|nr:hypothetical protein [Pseudomonadota bacterium]
MKITELFKKKQLIYQSIQTWGFNIEESTPPPQLYLDPYEESGEAKLCLLLKSHPKLEDVSNRRHFLEYELEKLLKCGVSVVEMENLVGGEQKKQATEKTIGLSAEEKDIIKYYGDENYSFVPAAKDPLLEFTEAESVREKLKQQTTQRISTLSLKNYSGTLLAAHTGVSNKPLEDKEMLRFLEYIRSNALINESVTKDPTLLLRAYRYVSSNLDDERSGLSSS